jgi:hypothetical protein
MTRAAALVAVAAGLVVTALFWIDALFVPLALLGPPLSGAVAGWRRLPLPPICVAWLVAGLGAAISDEVVNHEDLAFHLVLTVVMVGLAAGAWAVVRALRPLVATAG